MNFFVKAFLDKVVNNPEETGKIIKSLVEWYQQRQARNEESKRILSESIEALSKRVTDLERRFISLEDFQKSNQKGSDTMKR